MTRPKLRVIQGGANVPKATPGTERPPAPERTSRVERPEAPRRQPYPGPEPRRGGPMPIVLAVLLMGGLLMLMSGDPLLGAAMVLVGTAGFLAPLRASVDRWRTVAALGLVATAITLAVVDIVITLAR